MFNNFFFFFEIEKSILITDLILQCQNLYELQKKSISHPTFKNQYKNKNTIHDLQKQYFSFYLINRIVNFSYENEQCIYCIQVR